MDYPTRERAEHAARLFAREDQEFKVVVTEKVPV